MKIEELHSTAEYTNQLAELLIRVVDDGASVGFLPPLEKQRAEAYWKTAVTPDSFLWIAKQNGRIAGSVQLHLCTKQNGRHRAEICKLMTDPAFRRQGIARSLIFSCWIQGKKTRPTFFTLRSALPKPAAFPHTRNLQTAASMHPFFIIKNCDEAQKKALRSGAPF